MVRAFRAACAELGWTPPGLRVVADNAIPQGRGMGSLGRGRGRRGRRAPGRSARTSRCVDDDAVLRLATELEGHPDNVAAVPARRRDAVVDRADRGPARYGSTSTRDVHARRAGPRRRRCPPTSPAACCPTSVPHADAAYNAGRSGAAGARADPGAGAAARGHRGPAAPAAARRGDAGLDRADRPAAGRRATPPSSPAPARACWCSTGGPEDGGRGRPHSPRRGGRCSRWRSIRRVHQVLDRGPCRYRLDNEEHAGTNRCCPVRESASRLTA